MFVAIEIGADSALSFRFFFDNSCWVGCLVFRLALVQDFNKTIKTLACESCPDAVWLLCTLVTLVCSNQNTFTNTHSIDLVKSRNTVTGLSIDDTVRNRRAIFDLDLAAGCSVEECSQRTVTTISAVEHTSGTGNTSDTIPEGVLWANTLNQ